jgi:ribosomal protein S18 acetylase RimI-like enzyme
VSAQLVIVEIEVCTKIDDEVINAFTRLLPQLSKTSEPPAQNDLEKIISHSACSVLLARVEEKIVGSLTLVIFPLPTGKRAWIEDVVVDESIRGSGIGEKLNLVAIEIANKQGVRTIDLTSRPSREAANRLYKRLGFQERATNVYRYES